MTRKPWTLTSKLVTTGVVFLLLALASIGLTLWVTWNLEGGAAAVNEAGRMRMQTYRMALALSEGADPAAPRAMAREFDTSLALLASGDPSRPLFVPWSDATHARFDAVQGHWASLRGRWLGAEPPAGLAAEADAFVARVDGLVASIEAEIAHWTAILRAFQLAMMALAIASAVAMMYAGYLLVLHPVSRLKRGLADLQQGNLAARIEVDTGDEFGELSAGFNDMARTLESLYGTLEEKVREKTHRLEVKRQRLADLYTVSDFLARAASLDELAQGFARHIRRIARADATLVRWSDEGNRHYLLLASEGLPEGMAEHEGCIDTGHCDCAQARAEAATRVIPILPADAAPLRHCREAGFRTIVSVPVRLHERHMGEITLLFRETVELDGETRDLLDTLASHLASAMEGLRAAALEREAAVSEERSLLARELHDSIAQSLAFMKIQVQLLRAAQQRGDNAAIASVIAELDTGVRECYADVRELLVHFRTRTNEEDIEPALRTTLRKFELQTGVPATLEMHGQGVPLDPDVQVQVLHIVQEALSNARKHARASRVTLRVTARPHWRFEVIDDGQGFDSTHDRPDETHVGLRIMQERAARIGARVEVDARPGEGCRVRLALDGRTIAPEAAGAPALQAA